MTSVPPAKDYLEWVRLAVSVGILLVGVAIIVWFMMTSPEVIVDRSELFVGWFLGILTGSAIYLGILQRKPVA